jgi:hypothetical protein
MQVSVTWSLGRFGSWRFRCVACGAMLEVGFWDNAKLAHPANDCAYSGTKWRASYPSMLLELESRT